MIRIWTGQPTTSSACPRTARRLLAGPPVIDQPAGVPGPRRHRRDEGAKVVRALDRGRRRQLSDNYGKFARMALREVADVPSPKILEIRSGLGGLSRKL